MKLTVESRSEALALAESLANYICTVLTNAGFLHHHVNEDPFYTEMRDLLKKLDGYIKR